MIEIIGKEGILEVNPFNLSWGQKRRINLASLHSYFPSLYLLDEPFTGQDYIVRVDIIKSLINLLDEKKSAIISSHDEEILQFCSKILLIKDKQVSIFKKY